MLSLVWSGGRESSHKNFLNSHQNSHLTKTKKATSWVAPASCSFCLVYGS